MVLNIALAWLRLAQQTEALQEEAEPDVAADGDDDADMPADDEERQLAS
jgi:hypothetical protein